MSECDHRWEASSFAVLTDPVTYHRGCPKCRRVEQKSGDSEWARCTTKTYAAIVEELALDEQFRRRKLEQAKPEEAGNGN